MERLDREWLAAHPLPAVDAMADKNSRGRVLVAGGAEFVPGALRLTGEAALRAGAGKLQLATVRAAAIALGVLVPEAAMIALPADADGEIAPEAAEILAGRAADADALILGPGMSIGARTDRLVAGVLARPSPGLSVILDAAAITSAHHLDSVIARHEGRMILTPHHGEMAHLAEVPRDAVAADPQGFALAMAARFDAVILLKARESLIATPDGRCVGHEGRCAGLATSGSGDVLAGIVGGLAACGADPLTAAAWGCWLHGQAGEKLAESVGPVGFLARELPPLIPGLVAG